MIKSGSRARISSIAKPSELHGRKVVPSAFASSAQSGENTPSLASAASGIVASTGTSSAYR
jgi:hypothetical protein